MMTAKNSHSDDYFYNEFLPRFSTAQADPPIGVGIETSVRLANRIKLFNNVQSYNLWECPVAVLKQILKELRKEWSYNVLQHQSH